MKTWNIARPPPSSLAHSHDGGPGGLFLPSSVDVDFALSLSPFMLSHKHKLPLKCLGITLRILFQHLSVRRRAEAQTFGKPCQTWVAATSLFFAKNLTFLDHKAVLLSLFSVSGTQPGLLLGFRSTWTGFKQPPSYTLPRWNTCVILLPTLAVNGTVIQRFSCL